MAQTVVPSGSTVTYVANTSYDVQPGGTLSFPILVSESATGTIQFAGTGVGGGGAIVGPGSGLHLPGVNLVMTGNATFNAGSVTGTNFRFTNFGPLTGDFDLTTAGTKRASFLDQRTAGRTIITAGGFISEAITSGPMRAPALSPGNLELAGGTYIVGYFVSGSAAQSFTFTRPLGSGTGEVRWTGSGGFGSSWGTGNNRQLNLNINIGGASAGLSWGEQHFVPDGSRLIFSSVDLGGRVFWQNPINLAATASATREIEVAIDVQSPAAWAVGEATMQGVLSDSFGSGFAGGLTKTGGGVLHLSAANTYRGVTRAAAGTLNIATANALQFSTLDMAAADTGTMTFAQNSTLGGLSGSRSLNMGGLTLSIGNNDANTTYSGVLSNGGLTKVGSGQLTLSAASTYTGATTISGGTLALGAAGSFANSTTITVGDAGSAGAVLDLTAKTGAFSLGAGQTFGGGGTVRLASSGTLTVPGTFSPGNSPGLFIYDAGTTLLSGTTVMEIFGTSRSTASSHGDGFYDAVNVINGGILNFNGGTLQLVFDSLFADNTTFDLFSSFDTASLAGDFSNVSVSGSFYDGLTWNQTGSVWKSSNTVGGQSLEFDAGTGNLVIVPEPGSLALAGLGIAAGYALRRRRS